MFVVLHEVFSRNLLTTFNRKDYWTIIQYSELLREICEFVRIFNKSVSFKVLPTFVMSYVGILSNFIFAITARKDKVYNIFI